MAFHLSDASKRHREGVRSELIEISDLAIQMTLVDFGHGPLSGRRTAEEQHSLYLAGNSRADGFRDLSFHQTGNALDFYAWVGGRASWDPRHLAMVAAAHLQAAAILGYPISWGGLWLPDNPEPAEDGTQYGWDCGHIEYHGPS